MDAIWPEQPTTGFGVDPLSPHPPRPTEVVGARSAAKLHAMMIESCPRVPGVYGMLDRHGQLIYVGKSKSLRSRLLSYFADSNAQQKGARIIENTRAIQWETQPSEFAALVREQQLIRRFSPRWNVQGIPKRQRPVYLCLGRNPAPYFYLAPTALTQCHAVEGPFHGAGRMRQAVDSLNKLFKLRDCGQQQVFHFADQMQLFDMEHRPGCLRLEIGTCSGPCAAACTREAYDSQVNAAQSFLDGFNDEPLVVLQDQLDSAIANRQYELADRVHRALKPLEYVHRKLTELAKARRKYTFVYGVPGYDGCGTWYLIHSGEIAAVAAAPRNDQGYAAIQSTLRQWKSTVASQLDRGHGVYPHTLSLVASWFKKHRSELDRTFAPSPRTKLRSGSNMAFQR